MEVRGALRSSKLDEQLRSLGIPALDRDRLVDRSDDCEELAPDFPGIVSAAPGIGMFCAGQSCARIIDKGPSRHASPVMARAAAWSR